MKISHIKISNILGITDLEFDAGGFNEIAGGNGTNKSSLLNAIKSVIQGGHDATLLRTGATKGEVVLLLDDGTELRKVVRANTSSTTVRKNDVEMSKPMNTIKAITDLMSVNPVDFMLAPKADRVRVLLQTMPIKVDPIKVKELTGFDLPKMADESQGLVALETVRKQVYDARTGANRAIEEKEGTIKQLEAAMPAPPGGVTENEAELEATIAAAIEHADQQRRELQDKFDTWMRNKDSRLAEIENDAMAQIRVVEEEARAKIQAIKDRDMAEIADLNRNAVSAKERAAARRDAIAMELSERKDPAAVKLSVIKANRDATARRATTMETITAMKAKSAELAKESERHTKTLASIDEYKVNLLANLPIPGLEVVGTEILRDGVPFDRLNTAQQTSIALDIAKLRAGPLGLVCLDDAEHLDPATYAELQKQAAASDLQFFVSRVTQGQLTINTSNQP